MPTSDRDSLATLIAASMDGPGYEEASADYVIEHGWRPPAPVISDPDTPDTYPIRTAATDRDGEVWVSTYAGWATVLDGIGYQLGVIVAEHGPLTIVHTPACPHDSRSGTDDSRWRCDQCGADCGPNTYHATTEEGRRG